MVGGETTNESTDCTRTFSVKLVDTVYSVEVLFTGSIVSDRAYCSANRCQEGLGLKGLAKIGVPQARGLVA
jgi:hypothetical protein